MANEEQVIIAAQVTDEHNDSAQLHPMIADTATSLAAAGIAQRPEKLLADAGYCSQENLAALDDDDPATTGSITLASGGRSVVVGKPVAR